MKNKPLRLPTPRDPVRIVNCDCMDGLRRVADESVDHCITDPPYGIDFQSYQREDGHQFEKIANDEAPFVWWLKDAYRATKDGGCLLCFCRYDVAEAFRLAIGWAGYKVKGQIVWDKCVHGMGDLEGQPAPQHETVWFAVKGKYKLPAEHRPVSVVRHKRVLSGRIEHPNQKPLGLMRELVRDYTRPGDLVLEPFGGSGSTALACAREGRRCLAFELDASYCILACSRLAEMLNPDALANVVPRQE